MGQKTNPIGFRLGVSKQWRSKWHATKKDFPALLKEDELLRKYLKARLGGAAISDIVIERKPGKVVVTIHTGRPGVVIGKKGQAVEELKNELQQLTGKEVGVNVEEIKRPEIEAQLVADNISAQLAQRISFRRAMKRAVQSAMRMGAEGIKVKCSGRLGGAEIAREKGILIADTKFEFGQLDGELWLIDEVMTPDSSRFWPADQYSPGKGQPSFDKQFVRDWLETTTWDKNSPPPQLPLDVIERTREKYIEAFERLTGETFPFR